jgi:hypothetical protein
MGTPDYDEVPLHRRPLLVVAVLATCAAVGVGFTGDDELRILLPAGLGLLWAAAYRAQPAEGVRSARRQQPGTFVVQRPAAPEARMRPEITRPPSSHAPSAAVADAAGRGKVAKVERVKYGLPDLPTAAVRKPKRKRRGGDEGGKPTLGL